ncbi:MAG TPA: prepilin-type N-terminal cleavage/methylation domain-containing protein [Verrucomicrobiaceae bacterium]
MNSRFLSRRGSTAGFTLLEMVLGLTILAMLSGTVYSIISGAVQTASKMRLSQAENDQISHFIRLCRQTFQSLPSTATMTIKTTDTSIGAQEVTISGAPECFGFGSIPISYKDTILGLRPDAAATDAAEDKQPVFSLSITREDILPTDPGQNMAMVRTGADGVLAPDDQGRVWMPLLANVATLTWRAYKNDDEQWLDEWDSTDLPLLVEMNLLLSGRSQPIRAVYTLPAMKLTGANKALAPKKTATPAVAANNANAGGPGGNNARGNGKGGEKGKGRESKGRGGKGAPTGQRGQNPKGGQPGGKGGNTPTQGGFSKGGSGAAAGGGGAAAGGSAAGGGGKR